MKFINSIKFKLCLVTVIICAVISATVATVSIEKTKDSTEELVLSYIGDLTNAYGSELETMGEESGVEFINDYDTLNSKLGDIKIHGMSSSYAYMVSADGTMLYHPTKDKVGSPVENPAVSGVVSQLKSGTIPKPATVAYNYKGADKYAGYYVDSTGAFILVITADVEDCMATATEITKLGIMIGVVMVIVAAIAVFIILNTILAPLVYASKTVERYATLDLTKDTDASAVKYYKKKDECGVILRSIEELRSKFADVVSGLKIQGSSIFSASNGLSSSSGEGTDSVRLIETSVSEIATGATIQAEETQKATENVVTIGNMIEDTFDATKELTEAAEKTRALGQDAGKILNELIAGQQEMVASIEDVSVKTNEANESAAKISEVIEFITDIASETDLLSLNASIEAARAGEAGKGFAVVAESIKKLAEQTTNSAANINVVIGELAKNSKVTVQKTDEVKEKVAAQEIEIQKTTEIIGDVIENVNGLIDKIEAIAANVGEMDSAKNNVVDIIQSLSAVSQENAASTTETSNSVGVTLSTIEAIASEAEDLRKIAEELDASIKAFTVDEV